MAHSIPFSSSDIVEVPMRASRIALGSSSRVLGNECKGWARMAFAGHNLLVELNPASFSSSSLKRLSSSLTRLPHCLKLGQRSYDVGSGAVNGTEGRRSCPTSGNGFSDKPLLSAAVGLTPLLDLEHKQRQLQRRIQTRRALPVLFAELGEVDPDQILAVSAAVAGLALGIGIPVFYETQVKGSEQRENDQPCFPCKGTGSQTCRFCVGGGNISVELGGGEKEVSKCINCEGAGNITCTTCQGSGVQPRYLDRREYKDED